VRSLRIMWRYRLRSGLIVTSAALGVAGVVCPVNYGEGGAKQLLDQVRSMGTNVLIITPVADKSVAGRARTGGLVTTLVDRDLLAIQRDVTGLTRSSGLVAGSFWIKAGDLSKNATVVGCEPDFFAIRNWAVATGVLFNQSQERSMARVVVLGHTAALDLFGEEFPVGRPLMINRVPFIVAGAGGYNKRLHVLGKIFHDAQRRRRLPIQVDGQPEQLENFNDSQHGYLRVAVTRKKITLDYVAVPDPGLNAKDEILKPFDTVEVSL